MKALTKYFFSALVLGAMVFASPLAGAKGWPWFPKYKLEKVVISLQQNPQDEPKGLEAACVALQLGTGLLMSGEAEVTVFATLDGIYIVDEATYPLETELEPICDTLTPEFGLQEASLREVLDNFLNAGGEVLLCPLCLQVRVEMASDLGKPFVFIQPEVGQLDEAPIYAANPIELLLDADKVIDY